MNGDFQLLSFSGHRGYAWRISPGLPWPLVWFGPFSFVLYSVYGNLHNVLLYVHMLGALLLEYIWSILGIKVLGHASFYFGVWP